MRLPARPARLDAATSACVAHAGTSRIIEGAAAQVGFVPTVANAVALARELPLPHASTDQLPRPRVLYPASRRAAGTLETGLRARGVDVVRLDTYDTVAVERHDLAEHELRTLQRAAVIAVASPSALQAWMHVAGEQALQRSAVACIGSTTGEAALHRGLQARQVWWPEHPGLVGFVESIQAALRAQAQT